MGLRGTVLAAVHTAFAAIDDLATADVLYVRKPTTYNPVTGTYVGSDSNTTIPKAAIVGFDDKEIDGDVVKTNDRKVLFPGDILGFIPELTDIMQFALPGEMSVRTWNIKRNMAAPVGLLNVIHVREK